MHILVLKLVTSLSVYGLSTFGTENDHVIYYHCSSTTLELFKDL